MSHDDTWLNALAAELGEAPPLPGQLERVRRLARATDPWGGAPGDPELALARVLGRDVRARRTKRRVALLLSTAAALAVSFTPTLVRWRLDRAPGGPVHLNQVGLVFFTSSGY